MTASTPFDAGGARDPHPSPAPAAPTATRVRRRRRPSGEPPPLPRQLHTSGKRWLLLVGVAVVAGVLVGNVRPVAVAADVADHVVLSVFVATIGSVIVADILRRPRPLGVEVLGPWQESALPSVPMTFLTAILVTALSTLVPAGRLRERGKLVVAGLLAVTVLSRLYLAQEGPLDVLFAVVVGVAIPLAAFRMFVPNESFPVSYRRGRLQLDPERPQ